MPDKTFVSCPHCGSQLHPDASFCPYCGKRCQEGDRFCEFCGADLTEE